MAITTPSGNPVVGIKYTKVTDSPTDWASIVNDTYFYDKTDQLVYYKDVTGTVLKVFGQDKLVSGTNIKTVNGNSLLGSGDITISVQTAQKIYIDSEYGNNATGVVGDAAKPFLTPEYVLANITNTGTIAANTATNRTLSNISNADNASLKVGQYITGDGIDGGSMIVSKGNEGSNANTVTLNKATTATASGVTLAWWTPYIVKMSGTFTVTSSIAKSGFWIDAREATINFGAITLFDYGAINGSLIPVYLWFDKINGTSSSSYFFTNHSFSPILTDVCIIGNHYYSLRDDSVGGIQGNYQIDGYLGMSCTNCYIDIKMFDARFGNGARINASNSLKWYGNSYSLYGGISVTGSNNFISGVHESGGEVLRSSARTISSAFLYGDVAVVNGVFSNNGYIEGAISHISYGSVVKNYGEMRLTEFKPFESGASLINYGEIYLKTSGMVFDHSFLLENMGIISTYGAITAGTGVSGAINMNVAGVIIKNWGTIESLDSNTSIAPIRKVNGKLFLYPGSELRVANSKSPVQCTANTSASKDVYVFNTITNCDGSTYGLGFAFDGSSYAPNDLVGGLIYEDINY